MSLLVLAAIQAEKHLIRRSNEVVIARRFVLRKGSAPKDLTEHLMALGFREGVQGIEQLLGGFSHSIRMALSVWPVKFGLVFLR